MDPDHIILDVQSIPVLAVGIGRTRHGNVHTGVAYRTAKREVRFFHQAFHHVTRDGDIASEIGQMGVQFLCVVPPVEEDRARAIAGFWEFITGRGEQIGYALRDDPDALFDPNTGLLVLPNGKGLSCSTFVLALFRSVRLPLIDTTGWPADRPGDREAQEQTWSTWAEVKAAYPKASYYHCCLVFNICGGSYRLVVRRAKNWLTLFVVGVYTHREYDQDHWKEFCACR